MDLRLSEIIAPVDPKNLPDSTLGMFGVTREMIDGSDIQAKTAHMVSTLSGPEEVAATSEDQAQPLIPGTARNSTFGQDSQTTPGATIIRFPVERRGSAPSTEQAPAPPPPPPPNPPGIAENLVPWPRFNLQTRQYEVVFVSEVPKSRLPIVTMPSLHSVVPESITALTPQPEITVAEEITETPTPSIVRRTIDRVKARLDRRREDVTPEYENTAAEYAGNNRNNEPAILNVLGNHRNHIPRAGADLPPLAERSPRNIRTLRRVAAIAMVGIMSFIPFAADTSVPSAPPERAPVPEAIDQQTDNTPVLTSEQLEATRGFTLEDWQNLGRLIDFVNTHPEMTEEQLRDGLTWAASQNG